MPFAALARPIVLMVLLNMCNLHVGLCCSIWFPLTCAAELLNYEFDRKDLLCLGISSTAGVWYLLTKVLHLGWEPGTRNVPARRLWPIAGPVNCKSGCGALAYIARLTEYVAEMGRDGATEGVRSLYKLVML